MRKNTTKAVDSTKYDSDAIQQNDVIESSTLHSVHDLYRTVGTEQLSPQEGCSDDSSFALHDEQYNWNE